MLRKILTSVFLLMSLVPAVFAQGNLDITGTYNCTGNDPTFSPSAFTGKIIIFKKDKVYSIQETNSGPTPAGLVYQEVGIRMGNILSVVFQQADTKIFGVKAYKISQDGKKLVGSFFYWNKFNLKGTETCEKISDSVTVN